MPIDDPLLPAARHLVGAEAHGLLSTAVTAFGGALLQSEAVQVQHRPGHDLVVRYDAVVSWADAEPRRETLIAASTVSGAPEGTLVLNADDLEAGVWRYPFDPRLPGLAEAVNPSRVNRMLATRLGDHPTLVVVAYRPMRRAVVHASGDGHEVYLKVVEPSRAAGIASRHETLRAAGLPVPRVLDVDEARGLLVLDALPGENLRDRLLGSTNGWPSAASYVELTAAVASIRLEDAPGRAGASLDAAQIADAHAAALTAILPGEAARLDRITAAVRSLPTEGFQTVTNHGDFYEAQLLVDGDGDLCGLLDLDDVGIGHPLEDVATMLAHLHILRPPTAKHHAHLRRYQAALRTAFVEALAPEADAGELDRRTAGVLLGLATGPFRAQRDQWRREVRRRIGIADRLVASARPAPGEKTLRHAS